MKNAALRHLMAAGLVACGAGHSFANPTGGQVVGGSAGITTIPGTVTINQTSNIAIINWQTFSISSGELTKFIQPCSTSAALNRVLGGQVSTINGTLQANGQIYLINGNGIVVGPGGTVTANAFVGSTRDITDADFMSGNLHFSGNSDGGVQNFGTINALGGDVYLFGKTVDNQGAINAACGTAGLAAADDIMLNLCGEEHVFVSPSPTATPATTKTAVHNSGTIAAASAELKAANGNLYALAINNEGTVRATAVQNKGGRVFLTTDKGMVQNNGTIKAQNDKYGGTVKFTGGSVWNRKKIDVSGEDGGSVVINAENVQNDGSIDASGTRCEGGSVKITYSGNALANVKGSIDASGKLVGGTIDFLGTGPTSEAYLSLALNVNSAHGNAGSIDIDSPTIYLTGASLTANGATKGGNIFIGEGDPVRSPNLPIANIDFVSPGTKIQANATQSGNGGQIAMAGTSVNQFYGFAEAKAAGVSGVPGTVNVPNFGSNTPPIGTSGGGTTGGGTGNNPPPTTSASIFEFVDPDPAAGNAFGRPFTGLFNLASNNTLITSPGDSFGGAGAGAAYLFSNVNGALLSTIRGSHANDGVGSAVQLLLNGNYAIKSPNWAGGLGAVTFGNGTSGFAGGGGAVSALNSLVGSSTGDAAGSGGIIPLFNGNYLVLSPDWNGGAGAVTWVNPIAGIVGTISSGNSLVGTTANDAVGSGGIQQLNNGANYLVLSPNFDGGKGAITNGSDNTGVSGVVSSANSLVGANSGDHVGAAGSIFDTNFGYYLVTTANYNGGAGAVTWNDSGLGINGAVSSANSLVGSSSGDGVGSGGITLLNTENYVVNSFTWNNGAGAVTFGNGSSGVSGVVSSANSLIGASSGDHVGSGGVQPVFGGSSYVVYSPDWNGARGAVTLGDNTFGITGVVSPANSLVGASQGDIVGSGGISMLNNGNLLVLSPHFNSDAGAVTFFDMTAGGTTGIVSGGNSLIGANAGDSIGSDGIIQLSNGGNFLVLSSQWGGGKGAITNGDVNFGVTGVVSDENSLVGASTGDHVGAAGSVIDPFTGYYLVRTANWGNGAGAVTWSADIIGITGVVDASNSLVGSSSTDHVGSGGITFLFDGNYVVNSPNWSSQKGAVTWGDQNVGTSGVVSSANSLVGANAGDAIGSGGILQLSSGSNYLVLSPNFNGGIGAISNLDSSSATSGVVSSGNSLVGAAAGDHVGSAGSVLQTFNGYYLVTTANYGGGAGAVTWNSDTAAVTGAISSANSLVGSSAGDHVGSGGITLLFNGNYIVDSSDWNNARGAVTFGDGSTGVHGAVSSANSLVGANAGDAVGSDGVIRLASDNYLVHSQNFNNGAGAVTFGDGLVGVHGVVSSANSLVGASAGDSVGSGGILQFSDGVNYLVLSPLWNNGRGAITQADTSSGVSVVVSSANSLVGASAGDGVGTANTVLETANGYYLVSTANFGGGAGAVTWNDSNHGTTGVISSANSLVGSSSTDHVGDSITLLFNGNYVVDSPDWNGGKGAATFGTASAGVSGVVSSANSLVGANAGDHLGSGGITMLSNNNYLVLSSGFNGGAGAVTFGSGTSGITGVADSTNSLVGANAGDVIGSGGITFLDNGNYLVLSPMFGGGAGAVTFGTQGSGVAGIVSADNSLVGSSGSDHIGSGGIILLPNGNYLVQSQLFNDNAGAITWGSATAGVAGEINSGNSIIGGGPDSGEQYAGLSADGSLYLVSFTTDTSLGGDGRVLAGSVNGPVPLNPDNKLPDFFLDPRVIAFEAAQGHNLNSSMTYDISDPETMGKDNTGVDSLEDGALNNGGHGNNLALGSSTSHMSGPQRMVLPGNGVWNIFSGAVHSAPPPQFITQQLQLNLSPEVFANLNAMIFGAHH